MKISTWIFLLLCFSEILSAQLDWEEIEIPMRDGKFLSADLYRPNNTEAFPVVLIQTPYNKNLYHTVGLPLGIGANLSSSNYAFVILDWRCRFGSLSACSFGSSNGEDGYDAVEWIAEQNWSNGKIGTLGPSALGNVQFETAREQPPHLVCAVPEVASPYFHFESYFPGGSLITGRFKTLNLLFPTGGWDLIVNNPHYNLLWTITENSTMYPEEIKVPMLLIGGWYDHNTLDNVQMIDTLSNISDPSVRNQHKILIGPWVHGGTGFAQPGSSNQGDLDFPEAEGWNRQTALEFFDYYLRGIQNGWNNHSKYIFFQMGEMTWKESEFWPPQDLENIRLFLNNDGSLIHNQNQIGQASMQFNYNPEDPSPTVGGKTLSLGLNQGPYNQSEVENRSDNLIFSSEVLDEAIHVQGSIKTHLYVESNQPDTDFAIRITDVYPDGKSILLNESILRMRFRNGFRVTDTVFMKKGEVYPITIEFDDLAHSFLEGHQIRLIISSSNYPHYNRNMNTGKEMYPNSNFDTLVNPRIALNTIWMSENYPSHIEFPVTDFISSVQADAADLDQNIILFPNPCNESIFIKDYNNAIDLVSYEILDMVGNIKFISHDNRNAINTSFLEDGIYLLLVRTRQNKILHGKFVKTSIFK